MKKKIKHLFYTGLIALLPVILTFYFLAWIFDIGVGLLRNSFIVQFITDLLLSMERFNSTQEIQVYVRFLVYLIFIVGAFTLITLVGVTTKHVIGKKIATGLEELFIKVPIIKKVYMTFSQIIGLISSDSTKSYQKVVLLEYPRRGIYSLGFLTSEKNEYFEDITGKKNLLSIFVPTSPNPTSGMFVMVEEKEIKVLDLKVEEAFKLIISGGAISPVVRMSKINSKGEL